MGAGILLKKRPLPSPLPCEAVTAPSHQRLGGWGVGGGGPSGGLDLELEVPLRQVDSDQDQGTKF